MTTLRNNAIANVLGQAWRAIMALAFVPILIRELGPESYGLIGIYASLQSWLILVDMGLRPTLVREMARMKAGDHTPDSIRDLLRSAEVIAVLSCFCVFLGFWASSPWLAMHWLNASALPPATVASSLAIMGGVAALQVIESLYSGSIGGTERQVIQNALSSFTALLRGAGGAAVVVYGSSDVRSFFEWQGFVAAVGVVITGITLYAILPTGTRRAHFSLAALRKVKAYAGNMALITILVLVLTQVDKIILAKLLPLEIFGHYILATGVASALLYLSSPIIAAYFPRFVEFANGKFANAEEARAYHTSSQIVTVILGSIGITLCVLAIPVLRVWTGDDILATDVGPIVSLLALGYLCNGLMGIPYHLQLAHGWTSLTIKVNFCAAIVLTITLLYFVPEYGVKAAAINWCILNLGYLTVAVWIMHERLLPKEKWKWYVHDTMLPLAGMFATCLLVTELIPNKLNRAEELFGILFVSVATFSAGVLLCPIVRTFSKDFLVGRFSKLLYPSTWTRH